MYAKRIRCAIIGHQIVRDNPRSNEDQQLLLVIPFHRLPEQRAVADRPAKAF